MLLALLPFPAQAATVELVRGAPISKPGYWAVEDTYLDAAEANLDHGGGFTLAGGSRRMILIRFGDLNRFLKPNGTGAAKLVLTPSGGDVPRVKSVSLVRQPWGEGPVTTVARFIRPTDPKTKPEKPTTPKGAATWNEARAGLAPWEGLGASSSSIIKDAKVEFDGKQLTVAGLDAVVKGWVNAPWSNFGLALQFENEVEFNSSQSTDGRPRLVVETTPVASVVGADLAVVKIAKDGATWTATVKNVGTAPSGTRSLTWFTNGKAGTPVALDKVLGPGETTTVAYAGVEPVADLQVPNLAAGLSGELDGNPANDRLGIFATGKPIELKLTEALAADADQIVALWNETVAQHSRYSFAPEGVTDRVRLQAVQISADGAGDMVSALQQIGRALGLPQPRDTFSLPGVGSADRHPGLMGYGDTRFDGNVPGKLAIPYEPYPDAATDSAKLEPTDLLSATDVGRLNDPAGAIPLPRATLLRVMDLAGRPLGALSISVEGSGRPLTTIKTSDAGTVLLPSQGPDGPFGALAPDLSNGTLKMTATLNGVTDTAFVKAWRISDTFRRSGSPAVLIDVRFNLPMLALESGTDLTLDRLLSDSEKSEPAALAAITDGSDETAAKLAEKVGSWVEIDLGRDRTLGEISVLPGKEAFWSRFDIVAYATGQRPEEALTWAKEIDSGWARKNRSVNGWLVYRAPVQRVRFIRVLSRSGGPASLAGLRVVPIRATSTP